MSLSPSNNGYNSEYYSDYQSPSYEVQEESPSPFYYLNLFQNESNIPERKLDTNVSSMSSEDYKNNFFQIDPKKTSPTIFDTIVDSNPPKDFDHYGPTPPLESFLRIERPNSEVAKSTDDIWVTMKGKKSEEYKSKKSLKKKNSKRKSKSKIQKKKSKKTNRI